MQHILTDEELGRFAKMEMEYGSLLSELTQHVAHIEYDEKDARHVQIDKSLAETLFVAVFNATNDKFTYKPEQYEFEWI